MNWTWKHLGHDPFRPPLLTSNPGGVLSIL